MRIREKITTTALSVAVPLGLAAVAWAWNLSLEAKITRNRISTLEATISGDKRNDEQDKKIRQDLKYTAWLHRQVAKMFRIAGMEEPWLPENFWD